MSSNLEARNSELKGIPNQLVVFLLNSLGITFTGKDDNNEDTTESYPSNFISIARRKEIIWRRILNNLPRILKTIGTENSLNSLLRCYGVPDYLFKVKEFGGIKYTTDSDDDSIFSFDTFNYYIKFDQKNQYISIPWKSQNYNVGAFEFSMKLTSGYDSRSFIQEDDIKQYKVSKNSRIEDQDEGIISSNWVYAGNIFLKKEPIDDTRPYPVDVLGPEGSLLGHMTLTGFTSASKLYYIPDNGSYKDVLLVGDIQNNECHLTIKELEIVFCSSNNDGGEWTIGADIISRRDTDIYGYFYININGKKTYIKDQNDTGNPVLLNDNFYHFLINFKQDDLRNERYINIFIKRNTDEDIVLSKNFTLSLSRDEYETLIDRDELFFGNYIKNNLVCELDKVRTYQNNISESRFVNHILYNQGYDIEECTQLRDNLLVKINFDYPFNLQPTDGESYGKLENNVFSKLYGF